MKLETHNSTSYKENHPVGAKYMPSQKKTTELENNAWEILDSINGLQFNDAMNVVAVVMANILIAKHPNHDRLELLESWFRKFKDLYLTRFMNDEMWK